MLACQLNQDRHSKICCLKSIFFFFEVNLADVKLTQALLIQYNIIFSLMLFAQLGCIVMKFSMSVNIIRLCILPGNVCLVVTQPDNGRSLNW